MNLDLYTLTFFTILNTLFIILLIAIFLISNKKKYWFLNLLIAGLFLTIIGIILIGIGESIGHFFSIFTGNSLLTLGFATLAFSVISYKEEFRKKTFIIFLIAYFLFLIMFIFIYKTKYTLRVAHVSMWIFFYFFYASIHLIKFKKKKTTLITFIGLLILAYSLGFLYRGLYSLFFPNEYLINEENLQIIYYSLSNLLIILGSVGLLLLIKEIDEKIKDEDNKILKEANDSKVKLFTIISHDLKGPIGYIKPLVELLEKNCIQNKMNRAHDLIETIKDTSDNAFKLLENILEWSKNQFEYFKIHPVNFKIKEVVSEIIELYSIRANEKKVELICKKKCNIEVFADPDVIKIVLRNLISNALKFTPAGGLISIESHQTKENVNVIIKDTGVGIEEDKIPTIFKMNTKKTTAGTSGEIGTGLGLTLSAELIKKNNGTISLESQVNIGTTIKITLPSKEF